MKAMSQATTAPNPLCDFCWQHRSSYGLVLRGADEPYCFVCAPCQRPVMRRAVLREQLAAGRQAMVRLDVWAIVSEDLSCSTCHGVGVEVDDESGNDVTCSNCGGTGAFGDQTR